MESPRSEKEIFRKSANDAKFMRDEAQTREALLVAQKSKLAQQLVDVRKHVALFKCMRQNIVLSFVLIPGEDSKIFVVAFRSSVARVYHLVNEK